jgi:hypothetical protein
MSGVKRHERENADTNRGMCYIRIEIQKMI